MLWYKLLYVLVVDCAKKKLDRADERSTSMQYFFGMKIAFPFFFFALAVSHFPTLEHSVLLFISLYIALNSQLSCMEIQFLHVLSFHDFLLLDFHRFGETLNCCLFNERTAALSCKTFSAFTTWSTFTNWEKKIWKTQPNWDDLVIYIFFV